MTLKNPSIFKSEAEVEIKEILKSLKIKLGFADYKNDGYDYQIMTHNGVRGIYRIWDSSTHGSSTWEYDLITSDNDDLKAFDCICYLINYIKIKEYK